MIRTWHKVAALLAVFTLCIADAQAQRPSRGEGGDRGSRGEGGDRGSRGEGG